MFPYALYVIQPPVAETMSNCVIGQQRAAGRACDGARADRCRVDVRLHPRRQHYGADERTLYGAAAARTHGGVRARARESTHIETSPWCSAARGPRQHQRPPRPATTVLTIHTTSERKMAVILREARGGSDDEPCSRPRTGGVAGRAIRVARRGGGATAHALQSLQRHRWHDGRDGDGHGVRSVRWVANTLASAEHSRPREAHFPLAVLK